MNAIHGIHHITAIAGDPQRNLDFYSGALGMRLVKRSVNQDDPYTYHLFYADGEGNPGTDLTFFPWPGGRPGHVGTGMAAEVGLAVPEASQSFWRHRLWDAGVAPSTETRFGEPVVTFRDPDGMPVALYGIAAAGMTHAFAPWAGSPVPEEHQIRGLHVARLHEEDIERTARFLTATLGCTEVGEEGGWHRFAIDGGGSGRQVDVRGLGTAEPGSWGPGVVHHVAFRVTDDDEQVAVRDVVEAVGRKPTPVIDRFWFRSVYFREPGGVLFELATDGPGFTVDEDPERLGDRLILPPWLEEKRAAIEAALPPLSTAAHAPSREAGERRVQ
jgi:glyoxalase family protein